MGDITQNSLEAEWGKVSPVMFYPKMLKAGMGKKLLWLCSGIFGKVPVYHLV